MRNLPSKFHIEILKTSEDHSFSKIRYLVDDQKVNWLSFLWVSPNKKFGKNTHPVWLQHTFFQANVEVAATIQWLTNCLINGLWQSLNRKQFVFSNEINMRRSVVAEVEEKREKDKDGYVVLMQGTDITAQELHLLMLAHAHWRGVWLRPTGVSLFSALLLEGERPINAYTGSLVTKKMEWCDVISSQ